MGGFVCDSVSFFLRYLLMDCVIHPVLALIGCLWNVELVSGTFCMPRALTVFQGDIRLSNWSSPVGTRSSCRCSPRVLLFWWTEVVHTITSSCLILGPRIRLLFKSPRTVHSSHLKWYASTLRMSIDLSFEENKLVPVMVFCSLKAASGAIYANAIVVPISFKTCVP